MTPRSWVPNVPISTERDIGEMGYSQSTPQQVLIYIAETCIPYIAILDLSLVHPRLSFRALPDPLSGIEPEVVLCLCHLNPSRGISFILITIIINYRKILLFSIIFTSLNCSNNIHVLEDIHQSSYLLNYEFIIIQGL